MSLNELTLKILDISLKNDLLTGYSAKVNSTNLYGSISKYFRHGGSSYCGPMWNKPQGHGLS